MSTPALLNDLYARDVDLWVEDGRLRVSAPPGVLTGDLRDTLVARKADLLAFLEMATAAERAPIEPVGRDGPIPLSFAQLRLWFLHQVDPESPAYNVPAALALRGPLDADAFAQAFETVVDRHEPLRTRFVLDDAGPAQVVAPAGEGRGLDRVDLSALVPEARAEALDQRMAEAASAPFRIGDGDVWRAALVRLADDDHRLLMTMHHIVSDARSIDVLVTEVAATYLAAVEGREAGLPPLRIQYADFAAWQRAQADGDAWDARVARVVDRLQGGHATEVPIGRTRPPVQSLCGARLSRSIPEALSRPLAELAAAEDASLFIALLAAFDATLRVVSGDDDIVLGTDVGGREAAEVDALVGMFVNTVVLRSAVDGRASFRELLRTVRADTLEAFDHQDVPFDRLVAELAPDRDAGRHPLFQILFSFLDGGRPAADAALDLGGVSVDVVTPEAGTAKFDLELNIVETSSGLTATVEYSTDLYARDAMERLLDRYLGLLAAATSAPDAPLASLDALLPGEADWVADRHGPARLARPDAVPATGPGGAVAPCTLAPDPGATVLGRIGARAVARPDAVATAHAGPDGPAGHLTYQAVAARARAVAAGLSEALEDGTDVLLASEATVAVVAERSGAYWAAVLGTIAAGGVYVPLGPGDPPDRHAAAAIAAGVRAILCDADHADAAHAAAHAASEALGYPVAVLALDGSRLDVPTPAPVVDAASAPDWLARRAPHPDRAAYVLFTSGSTGTPKGAAVPHRGLLAHTLAKEETLALTPEDAIAQVAPSTFDVSVWQALTGWAAGARVEVVARREPWVLARAVGRSRATVVEVVPSVLASLLAGDASGDESLARWARPVRWLMATGEPLPPADAARWQRLAPWAPVVNAYGPTECSDDVTHAVIADLSADDASDDASGLPVRVPIGRALPGVSTWVVGPDGRLAPPGAPGELWVGGDQVGRGYVGRPGRTATSFVPCPWGAAGARAYRTGDVVRWVSPPHGDGVPELEYLGRRDGQVKVRGQRVELGEVEWGLRSVEGVGSAAAAVWGAGAEARLVGYVVAEPGADALDGEAVRQAAAAWLPGPSRPSQVVVLGALPTSRNGKVDRGALPAPGAVERAPSRPCATATERAVALAFAGVLGVESVGADDDFFALGGHSLLATRLLMRLRQIYRVEIPLRMLFEASSVEAVASALEGSEARPGLMGRISSAYLQIQSMSDAEKEDLLSRTGHV